MLFRGVSIFDVTADANRRIRESIQRMNGNYLLNASEEDLVRAVIDEFRAEVPSIHEDSIHVDVGEQSIDVSRDPMRGILDRSRPFYVPGTRVTFIIPFSGDGSWFSIQPQNFTWSSAGSNAEVKHQEIHVTYTGSNLNAEQAKANFTSELNLLKQNLANLTIDLERYNTGLDQSIRTQLSQRKAKLLQDASLASSLGFPMKRREGTPTTFAIPVQRSKPPVTRPAPSTAPFKPEPTLDLAEYDAILSIIRNMVNVMEQSPQAFEKMGEEDLRTHFLVQLNGQYEGTATGETFNFQGKTDILIRAEGKNVFIAECKFWAGEKQFLETIDQLLGYLSWRDTKAAVIIFNRNQNFSDVLTKIKVAITKHPQHKRPTPQLDESSFRHIFGQPGDANREVTVTFMAFDIPKPTKDV
jgi:hypothetical protein